MAKGSTPLGTNSLTGFHALAEFVLALTNADKDGRILVVPSSANPEPVDGQLKFVMLNAAKHFTEVYMGLTLVFNKSWFIP